MSRILIIDDEEGVRSELKERIDSMGHESEEAECVESALKLIQEMAFDCILLDLAIPVKFEGVVRVDHGKNLLQRIVAMENAAPVIVVTANHKAGHKVAIECIELGAATFVGKDFEEDPVEPKIRLILDGKLSKRIARSQPRTEFSGGVMVLHEDCIELNEKVVGGVKGNAYIRKVVEILADKKNGAYRKASAKQLAEAIHEQTSPPAVTSAIKEFRRSCTEKAGCGDHDVIKTCPGGGYQLAEGIEVKIGREESPKTEADSDRLKVLNQIKRKEARTRRQISDSAGIPQIRVRKALSRLEDEKVIRHDGSGSNVHYSLAKN
jgi:DNA-binding response OmpR family regulator